MTIRLSALGLGIVALRSWLTGVERFTIIVCENYDTFWLLRTENTKFFALYHGLRFFYVKCKPKEQNWSSRNLVSISPRTPIYLRGFTCSYISILTRFKNTAREKGVPNPVLILTWCPDRQYDMWHLWHILETCMTQVHSQLKPWRGSTSLIYLDVISTSLIYNVPNPNICPANLVHSSWSTSFNGQHNHAVA